MISTWLISSYGGNMKINVINNFGEFTDEMRKIGFCLSGNNGEGIFSLEKYYSEDIEYHTGDLELDPWQWRHRAVEETKDIFYGKVFHGKSGWITKEWINDFVSVRRRGKSIDDLYKDGLISKMDKSIYAYIKDNNKASLVEIKNEFGKENKTQIAKSITNLQMKILITMCGETRKISAQGIPYGWPVTLFSTVEARYHHDILEDDSTTSSEESYLKISDHIKVLNPEVNEKKIKSFIKKYL